MSATTFSSFENFESPTGMGQNGGRITLNYFDGLPDQNIINSLESNDLKLLFKSMLKRDEVTKDRALKEFINIIKSAEDNKINELNDLVLICWSQMFAKFSIDNSKAIRGQSQLITILLIKMLKKKISRFLPDLIPFILMGVYDMDTTLAKSNLENLTEIFTQDKVIKLWKTFQSQIIQLCTECLINEDMNSLSEETHTPIEERTLKYDRTASTCLQLLIHMVDTDYENLKNSQKAQDLLSNESLWNLLSLKNDTNPKLYETVLQLINSLQNIEYWKSKKHVLKYMSKRLFKSIAQINSKNVMKFKQLLPTLLLCVNHLSTIKSGRIWKYDKHSNEKFYSLLKCSCIHAPLNYFKHLYSITQKSFELEDIEILNTDQWANIWQKALHSLNSRPFVGKDGNKITDEFWYYYPKLKDLLHLDLERQLLETLDSCIRVSELPSFCRVCSDNIPEDQLEINIKSVVENTDQDKSHSKNYSDNLLTVAFTNEKMSLKPLVEWLVDYISIQSHNVINSSVSKILTAIVRGTSQNTLSLKPYLTQHLPSWVDSGNFELLSKLLVTYLNSNDLVGDRTRELMDDFFIMSYKERDIPCEKIVNMLKTIKTTILQKYLNCTKLTTVKEILDDYIENYYHFEDNGALFTNELVTTDYIPKLYQLAKESNKLEIMVEAYSTFSPSTLTTLISNTELIDDILINSAYGLKILAHTLKVLKNLKDNKETSVLADKIICLIIDKVFKHINKNDADLEFLVNLICKLLTEGDHSFDVLLPSNFSDKIVSNVRVIDYRVSLINDFKQSALFVDNGVWKTDDLNDIKSLIIYSKVLDEVMVEHPEYLNDEILLFLTLVYEIVNDYNFLSPSPDDSFFDIKHSLFKRSDTKFKFFDILERLLDENNNGNGDNSLLELLLKSEENHVLQYYKSIVIYRIMSNEADTVSNTSLIESLPFIEKYVTKLVRAKSVNSQSFFNGSLVLSVLSKVIEADSFSKLRTLLSSELIGTKVGELKTNAFKKIILLNNILPLDNLFEENDKTSIPIAPQRFSMLLNSVNQWLDSDICFDEDFINARISLLQLFTKLLHFPGVVDFNASVSEISERLLNDSLTMCQLDDTPCLFSLRFGCIELFNIMEKNKNWTDEDIHEEIIDNLMELLVLNIPDDVNNQVSSTFYSILCKQLNSLKSAKVLAMFDTILKNYLNCYVTNISQNRMLVELLVKCIQEKQQEELIEFELSHQNTSTHFHQADKISHENTPDNTAADEKYKIPNVLVNHLLNIMPEEYLENEDPFKFLRYLWDWFLALQYFKDISYKMRQLYIEQLKNSDLINKMFTFITDQINFQISQDKINEEIIKNYQLNDYYNQPYYGDIQNECHNLLIHLLYRLFNEVGSLTSHWFMNIRDKSHQQAIDKFVIKYISPMLINDAINQVEKDINKLESQDDNLSIKLNRITNEIKARYTIDEQKLEISFNLPENYPLHNIKVIGVSKVGISEMKWKQWIMSTQHVIIGTNGTMLDSLELFTKNVNLEFSGFEECAICYSILHIVDRKLPNKTCPTCNNKFHGACLYKWFRSSGKNTCPLCRTEIGFRN